MSSAQRGLPAVLAYTWPDEGVDINASNTKPDGGSDRRVSVPAVHPPKLSLSAADKRRVSKVNHPRASPPCPQPSAAEELASLKEQQQAITRRISEVQEEMGLDGDQEQAGAAWAKDGERARFVANSTAELPASDATRVTADANGGGRDLGNGPNAQAGGFFRDGTRFVPGANAPMGPNAEAGSPTATKSLSPVSSPKSARRASAKPADVHATLSALFCMHPRDSKEGTPIAGAQR